MLSVTGITKVNRVTVDKNATTVLSVKPNGQFGSGLPLQDRKTKTSVMVDTTLDTHESSSGHQPATTTLQVGKAEPLVVLDVHQLWAKHSRAMSEDRLTPRVLNSPVWKTIQHVQQLW